MHVKTPAWVRDLPHSRMTYPDTFLEKVRYWFWRFYTPLHPSLRDTLTKLYLLHHRKRQDFLIGTLHPSRSAQEFAEYLVANGFGNHFVAWRDAGELVSLRKTDGFKYQYHLRIFIDGEIRCHYEYTPEYRPILHLIEIGFENRISEFKTILEGWIVPVVVTEPTVQ